MQAGEVRIKITHTALCHTDSYTLSGQVRGTEGGEGSRWQQERGQEVRTSLAEANALQNLYSQPHKDEYWPLGVCILTYTPWHAGISGKDIDTGLCDVSQEGGGRCVSWIIFMKLKDKNESNILMLINLPPVFVFFVFFHISILLCFVFVSFFWLTFFIPWCGQDPEGLFPCILGHEAAG